MLDLTPELEYRLVITDKKSNVTILDVTSPTMEMLEEKFGAFERAANLTCAHCGGSLSLDDYMNKEKVCGVDCAVERESELAEAAVTGN